MAKRLKVVPESELEYLRKRGGCSRVEAAVRDLYGEPEPENLQQPGPSQPTALQQPSGPVVPQLPPPPLPPQPLAQPSAPPPIVEPLEEEVRARQYSVAKLVDIFSENVRTVLNLLKRCTLTWDEDSGLVSLAGYPIRGSNIIHVIEALIGQYEPPMAVAELRRKRRAAGGSDIGAVPYTIQTRGAKRRRLDEEYQKKQQQQQGQGYIQWASY